jgi:hypothetical protein
MYIYVCRFLVHLAFVCTHRCVWYTHITYVWHKHTCVWQTHMCVANTNVCGKHTIAPLSMDVCACIMHLHMHVSCTHTYTHIVSMDLCTCSMHLHTYVSSTHTHTHTHSLTYSFHGPVRLVYASTYMGHAHVRVYVRVYRSSVPNFNRLMHLCTDTYVLSLSYTHARMFIEAVYPIAVDRCTCLVYIHVRHMRALSFTHMRACV